MGCGMSKEQAPPKPRPQITRTQAGTRDTNGCEHDYNTEFWRQASYLQERNKRFLWEDRAIAEVGPRTDEYGRRLR